MQRTQCKLDRIVAVHSRGFTSSAKKIAKECNVELIEACEISDAELREALLPVDGVEMCRLRIRYIGMQAQVQADRRPSDDAVLCIQGRPPLNWPQIEDLVRTSLRREVRLLTRSECNRQYLDGGRLLVIRFRIPLAPTAELVFPSGEHFAVSHVAGEAEMQRVCTHFQQTRVLDYAGCPVLVGKDPQAQGEARLTVVPTDNGRLAVAAVVLMDPGDSELTLELPDLRAEGLS